MRISNIGTLLTMRPGAADRLGTVHDAAVVIDADRIVYAGEASGAPAHSGDTIDAGGAVVSPGLVDPHTHVVYAGDRAREFAMRAQGKSYAEIAAAGGGILSTVRATREAGTDELVRLARPRLRRMLERGVTTVEAKSGYGLELNSELTLLRAMQTLNADPELPEIVSTFLGAHAIAPEYRDQDDGADAYLQTVIDDMLPAVAAEDLATFCDVFVERGFFTVEQGRRVLTAAATHGLRPKLHVDQLTAGGGAELAAEVGAVSADHLDHASNDSLAALAEAGTVAVLLPGAALYLGDEAPQARRFLDAGVRVALATDCNPGTSPTEDLPLMMTFACTLCGITVDEAWLAVTRHAAAAVGRDDIGQLDEGFRANLVVWDIDDPAALPYRFGYPRTRVVCMGGRTVYSTEKQRG